MARLVFDAEIDDVDHVTEIIQSYPAACAAFTPVRAYVIVTIDGEADVLDAIAENLDIVETAH